MVKRGGVDRILVGHANAAIGGLPTTFRKTSATYGGMVTIDGEVLRVRFGRVRRAYPD